MTELDGKVNPHYLDNVMVVADDREVQATEDIYADNGMKLIAKGRPINRDMRDRLLERKLRKPLEDCMEVASGITGAQCAQAAQELLDQHESLRVLCSVPRFNPVKLLGEMVVKGRLQTLLTVYCEHRPQKLQHAVSVALLGMGMSQRIQPGTTDLAQVVLTACMCHDVGELYINPEYLAPGVKLDAQQWRHIAAHPVVAHKLLNGLPGPCRPASALVLDHHERLDGFGYPHGRMGKDIAVGSQIVALAEMLGGMLGKVNSPFKQADVAVKLIPGEFSRPIIDLVSAINHQSSEAKNASASVAVADVLQQAGKVAGQMGRVSDLHAEFSGDLERASPAFKALLVSARDRFERIQRAWSSTGLDTHPPHMLADLDLFKDEEVSLEVAMIIKEVIWRLRELERELRIRVQNVAPAELPMLDRYFASLLAASPKRAVQAQAMA
ncbi:MAG: HD domain-containing protein [Rubrivivax sp.]|nr:MAG: HD domain-containing protein [Rubrivivax sp.]